MKHAIILVSLFVLTSDANAAIVEADDLVFGIGSLTLDTDQMLYFLDLTISQNRSFNDVSGEFGVGGDFDGFRYATEQEVINLVNNWGFSPGAVAGANVNGDTGGDQLSGLVDLIGVTIPNSRWASGFTSTQVTTTNRLVEILDRVPLTSNDTVASSGAFSLSSASATAGSFLVRSSSIPEPSSLALMGLTAIGFCGVRLRRRRKAKVA